MLYLFSGLIVCLYGALLVGLSDCLSVWCPVGVIVCVSDVMLVCLSDYLCV